MLVDMQMRPELIDRISADANHALDATFGEYVHRRSELRSPVAPGFSDALMRIAGTDEEFRKMPVPPSPTLEQATADLRNNRKPLTLQRASAVPSARALSVWPYRGGRRSPAAPLDVPEDTTLQVLSPPYGGAWTSPQQSGNSVAQVNADRSTGTFGFLDGAAGGSAACGAGIWAWFTPDPPLPRMVQVRAYTPYDYQWDDRSQTGYTAHNDAGFGVYVLSWDFQGNNQQLEQDYRYPVWSDGTGWWEEHSNSSWPGSDYDYAYLYGNEAPYFMANPGRVYAAAIWCFGSCDAGSGFFGNAVSAADINATAGFVVIGEQ